MIHFRSNFLFTDSSSEDKGTGTSKEQATSGLDEKGTASAQSKEPDSNGKKLSGYISLYKI